MTDPREETEANSKYIEEQGYKIVQIWEFKWLKMTRTNLAIHHFLKSKFDRPLDRYMNPSQKQILSAVRKNYLFGVVECDIHVPDHLKPKFSEMCPIFKNIEVERKDIGEYMGAFAEKHNIMPRPRKTSIGSFYGGKILLATPLLKWYLLHGLKVTRIYQVIEYTPVPCFKRFGDAVSDAVSVSRQGNNCRYNEIGELLESYVYKLIC